MRSYLIFSLALVALFSIGCRSAVIGPRERDTVSKVFNYQGALPIKDDRTGEVIRNDDSDTPVLDTSSNQTVDEQACWNLIVDQSTVTFALQNRVLDELNEEMKDLSMEHRFKVALDALVSRMRSSMRDALDAINSESPEDYFEALFDNSESIVLFSSMIRDPKLDEKVFLVLVKAVSRLGRNNSALIQDFVDNCTIVERSQPRPRRFGF